MDKIVKEHPTLTQSVKFLQCCGDDALSILSWDVDIRQRSRNFLISNMVITKNGYKYKRKTDHDKPLWDKPKDKYMLNRLIKFHLCPFSEESQIDRVNLYKPDTNLINLDYPSLISISTNNHHIDIIAVDGDNLYIADISLEGDRESELWIRDITLDLYHELILSLYHYDIEGLSNIIGFREEFSEFNIIHSHIYPLTFWDTLDRLSGGPRILKGYLLEISSDIVLPKHIPTVRAYVTMIERSAKKSMEFIISKVQKIQVEDD